MVRLCCHPPTHPRLQYTHPIFQVQISSMYVRVKRQKSTIFLQVEPTDTILHLKTKLQDILQATPEHQQLYKEDTHLEDDKNLAELKIESDGVLIVALLRPDGTWEPAELPGEDDDDEHGDGDDCGEK